MCVCVRALLCHRAASQLGDNYTPISGPGLPPGSTVSSYLEHVSDSCAAVLFGTAQVNASVPAKAASLSVTLAVLHSAHGCYMRSGS